MKTALTRYCKMFHIIILLIALGIYAYFKHAYLYWRKRGVETQNPVFPFGNVFSVIFRSQSVNDKVCEIYREMKSKGCKFAGMYFFSRKVFLAIDPYIIKCVLAKDFQHFNDRGIHYDEINDPISAHLFSLSGTKWKNLRSKLTPAFTAGKVKFMFGTILECANEMVSVIKGELRVENTVEIKDILARFTTDVIGSCAFGIECNSLKNPTAEFRVMGRRAFMQTPSDAFKMIIIRSFPQIARIFKLGVFSASVSNFFKSAVEDTVEFREREGISRKDFLQLLIQLKNNGYLDGDVDQGDCGVALTMNEASAQAFIFFLAGFETTSTTVSFALLELALNTEMQERAREELVGVLSKHEDQLSYEAITELQYLEKIVLESLRKYPPAPVFLRKCTKDYQVLDTDVIVEKGLSVLIPAMALHRDPEFYPEPELFQPERFDGEHRKDYTYMPFGDGPRICIGMRFAMVQSKLALAVILKHFRFIISEKTQLPLVMEKRGIILSPVGGIWIQFEEIA